MTSFSGKFSSQLGFLPFFTEPWKENFVRTAFVGSGEIKTVYCCIVPRVFSSRDEAMSSSPSTEPGLATLTRKDSHSTTSYSLEDPCLTCFAMDSTSRRTGRANDCGPFLTHHPHSLRNGCFARH